MKKINNKIRLKVLGILVGNHIYCSYDTEVIDCWFHVLNFRLFVIRGDIANTSVISLMMKLMLLVQI